MIVKLPPKPQSIGMFSFSILMGYMKKLNLLVSLHSKLMQKEYDTYQTRLA